MKGERTMVPDARPVSYYGRPVLKEPVWKWMIPAYFFTGGVAAGSALLAFGARRRRNPRLARTANLTAVTAVATSAGLLVEDLGRPERFINMLRVAKPTSPMSVGTWLLTVFGPATGVAALSDITGVAPGLGRRAEAVAAAIAPAIATYTAVLVADTAIPAWHESRHLLPFVFAAGAAASAGGLAVMLVPPTDAGPARRLALVGAAGELIATRAMQRRLQAAGVSVEDGRASAMSRAARMATAAGAGVLAAVGRRRSGAILGAGLVVTGAALERFAVVEAGRESARDPHATIGPQRHRVDRARTMTRG